MRSSRITPLILACTTALSGACVGPRAEPAMGQLELRWSDPTQTLTRDLRLGVRVADPDGKHHDTNGEIAKGGTVRALCRSLQSSLRHAGCLAMYRDGGEESDQLARSQHQIIELEKGWRLVFVGPYVDGPRAKEHLLITMHPR